MKYSLRKILLSFVFISIIFISCIISTENIKASPGPGIAISPEYPNEQIQKSGIFNVIFKSNKQYNLTLKVDNITNNDKTVIVSPNTAYTSNNGNMLFDKSKAPNDSTRRYDFRSLFIQKEKKVTVPANSVSKVNFKLKMPPEQYQGIIAGGFYITIPSKEDNTTNSNFKINNNFSYSLPVIIHNNKGTAHPTLKLNNVNTNNNNNNLLVQSNIQNAGAGMISGMNINSEIIRSSNNQIINRSNSNSLSMAPNSSFNYNNIINNNLAPGQYRIKLNANDNMGNHWQESKDFKISAQNSASHFIKKVPWTLYTLIGIIVLLALVIIFLVYHQFRSKKKNNNQSNNQNKSSTKNNE